jgi:hypothetical protein
MSEPVPVFEAVEWREAAPGGGSQAQVFRLADGRFTIVKFPENPQGELVLANEFMSCQLGELLNLPLNRAILISIDERLLRLPRQNNQIPATFSAGVRCGMIRFEKAEGCSSADVLNHCENHSDFHAIPVFEQLVSRQDGRQLLMYPNEGATSKRFAAYDYGFAFGGQPQWSAATLGGIPIAALPTNDPFTGQPYSDGAELNGVIDRLRSLSTEQINNALMKLHPPRWGVTRADAQAVSETLQDRATALVTQFDERRGKQMEAF